MLGRPLRSLLVLLTTAAIASPAFAEFPDKPIRMIVPYPAGGLTDVLARSIANAMGQNGGPNVVVENRPGASGGIGARAVANAAPDGYTVLVSNTDTHAINPFIYRNLPYDPIKDFEPVSLFARVPFAVVSGPSQPSIGDFKQFVATAKASPGTLSFASWGVGSASHLGMELVARAVGAELHHVPFSGQAPGIQAVQGGHVDAMTLQPGGAYAAAQGGTVKVLAVTSDKRLDIMPEVPTLRELGVDVVTGNWFAFHVPAGTAPAVVAKLSKLTSDAVRDPKVRETFLAQSAIPESSTPEELKAFTLSEQERWGDVARALKVTLD